MGKDWYQSYPQIIIINSGFFHDTWPSPLLFLNQTMTIVRVSRKDHKRLNNPFPSNPRTLGFIHGSLFCNPKIVPDKGFSIGGSFNVFWRNRNGGCLSVYHETEPERSIWCTIPGDAFVSGGFAKSSVEESRGSFVINEDGVFSCCHQTVEEIRLVSHQEVITLIDDDLEFCSSDEKLGFSDEILGTHLPVLVVRGCVYSSWDLGSEQFQSFIQEPNSTRGPFYTMSSRNHDGGVSLIAARYLVCFVQKSGHQLGFHVRFGKANVQYSKGGGYCRTSSSRSLRKISGFRRWSSRFSSRPRGFVRLSMRLRGKERVSHVESEELVRGEGVEVMYRLNRVFITYSSEEDEKFFGFGEQFSHMEFKGRRVPIFVQEQGLGRGDQPITLAANIVSYRAGGDWSTTYAPSPFYMTSKMKSVFLEGYDYSVFDLTKPNRVQIQVNSFSAQGRILHGDSPLTILEQYTETIGRLPELPKWILSGAVVGMQGGTNIVRNIWSLLRDYDVPISSFWLQDWVGERKTAIGSQLWWNWEVDIHRYDGWSELVKELRSYNIKIMAYCNPCLSLIDKKPHKRHLFEEASRLGLFVKNNLGSTYMVPNTCFDVGMLDFTNPEACRWFKNVLFEMVDAGVRGWMADFGEGLPLDACLHSGEDPVSAHNRYPELWAKVNREFVNEWKSMKKGKESEDPEESLVFFMRAGFRESPKWATLFWAGDQMVSWQRNDGIKSAVIGLLSGGLSGYSLNHSDIGGYCAVTFPFVKYHRSEELLLRWMELNAFGTIFRTHEGNRPSVNSQFYSNHRTLSHFARFAKVYKAWMFYRAELVKEASQKGLPVIRHLFLHYPNDRRVLTLTYEQFLVGSEIMVAPVLDKGVKQVKVYFPLLEGCAWQHIWTGKLYGQSSFHGETNKGLECLVEAPIGYPAVFVKSGSRVAEEFMKNLSDLEIV